MIFVDSNVIMYAVGRPHPLRTPARDFFLSKFRDGEDKRESLATSAEVLQELLHAYLPVGRPETLNAALHLVTARIPTVWPVEKDDVLHAHSIQPKYSGLSARDLLHVACCQRRDVRRVETFDRALAAAFDS